MKNMSYIIKMVFALVFVILICIFTVTKLLNKYTRIHPVKYEPYPSPEIILALKRLYKDALKSINDTEYVSWTPNNKMNKYYKFSNMSLEDTNYFIDLQKLPEIAVQEYFYKLNNNTTCFKDGMEKISKNNSYNTCTCKNNFNGSHCSVPASIWKIHENFQSFTIRNRSRSIIMGIIVNHELGLTEVRIRQLQSIVDIFVILESKITSGGDEKPLHFFNAFKNGFLSDIQDRILYIHLDKIPLIYIEDGWMLEAYLRNIMSKSALARIKGLKNEDLFLSFDADEIPNQEVLTFLKIHNTRRDGGNLNPIQFNLRWSVFKYYWIHIDEEKLLTSVIAGCTIKYLKEKCQNKIYSLRNSECVYNEPFEIGFLENYAGHHCSWCFTPKGIRIKMISAQRSDGPRWGSYLEKLDLNYISNLIKNGIWFDDNWILRMVGTQKSEPEFAPKYILSHSEDFKDLLRHST